MTKKMNEDGNGRAIGFAMLVGSIGMIALCLLCIVGLAKCVPSRPIENKVKVDTMTVVVYDTIHYYNPIPKDSVVLKYITERLSVIDTIEVADSVEVKLPITQKHYEDSAYSAWVSGYRPNLDSIKVYRRKEREVITINIKEAKRWNIGVSGGMGMVYDGNEWHCGPGINIGITYNF